MGSWCKKNKYPGLPRMSLKFPASEHLITSRFSQQIPHFTCNMKLQHLQLFTTEPWLILPASVCLLSLLGSGFELVRNHVWEILWRRSIPLRLAEYDQHGHSFPSCILRLLRKFEKPQLRMFLRCTISIHFRDSELQNGLQRSHLHEEHLGIVMYIDLIVWLRVILSLSCTSSSSN